ncbi:MAG: ABC transporter permease [Egibacteraceae bacterium]
MRCWGRELLLVPVLAVLSVVVFGFVRALPGGPAQALLGERATPETREALERQLGLDRPLAVQYLSYVRAIARGDLGVSLRSRRSVTEELAQRFPATVELAVAAMAFAVLAGIPLGFVAAKRYQGALDHASLVASLIGISFLALMLKYVFAVRLGWLPSIGRLSVTMMLDHPTDFYVPSDLPPRVLG